MIRAGVKDVKNNLSRFLAQVKDGEEILITERGKPIARIVREDLNEKSIRSVLGPLIQKDFFQPIDSIADRVMTLQRDQSISRISDCKGRQQTAACEYPS